MSVVNQPPAGASPLGEPVTLRSAGPDETRRLGVLLGELLRPGDVVLLQGPLGAGKTALTQGIAAGLGVRGTVNSPTFTILKEYEGRLPLHHFDLYRIEDPEELYALGFDEYFLGDGVSVVEWAERGETGEPGAEPWPASYVRIRIQPDGTEARMLTCTGGGARGAELALAFAARARQEGIG